MVVVLVRYSLSDGGNVLWQSLLTQSSHCTPADCTDPLDHVRMGQAQRLC
jgi:hypothetical protein